MKNKTLTWLVFGICILLLAFILVPGWLMERNDGIDQALDELYQYARQERWQEARTQYAVLHQRWNSRKFWIALNYAESDYTTLDEAIARIEAAVDAEDRETIMEQCAAVATLLHNIMCPVPGP